MKAMLIGEFGGPEVFKAEEVGQPDLRPNDLLVKVHATSVNPVDLKIRQAGQWAGVKPPAIIGYDASGVVEDVGEAVEYFAVGDAVYYTPEVLLGEPGTYAEYHAVNESIVAHKPVNLSHQEAASIPLAGGTAFQALILRAKLRVGESVLIHGCGGVGAWLCRLPRRLVRSSLSLAATTWSILQLSWAPTGSSTTKMKISRMLSWRRPTTWASTWSSTPSAAACWDAASR
jgi:NADPH:quinone reductase-like Zn-dependent oxidoreductase